MKNLLVITPGYPQLGTNRYNYPFVKSFTDLVSDKFDNIYVISPQWYFPKHLRKFNYFSKFSRLSNFYNYNYNNIKVFFPICYNIPFITRNINWEIQLNAIIKTIKRNNINFDIIHCHFFWNGLWAKKLKELYMDKKVIIHCHDSTLKKELSDDPQKCISIFNSVDAIISFCLQNKILNKFFKKNKIKTKNSYISNFVDVNKFYPKLETEKLRRTYGFKNNDKILICVSNIYKDKGQTDILSIWDDLSKEIKNLHLILIGDGENKFNVIRTINEINDKNIHYLGPKNNEEIVNYLNISDLFLFPSYHETFGIAPIEAISCGIPVIAYKNGGSEYLIKDKKIGTIIEKQDINLFKEGIIKMLNKRYDKEYLHKYVVDRYSGEIIKEHLITLYDN